MTLKQASRGELREMLRGARAAQKRQHENVVAIAQQLHEARERITDLEAEIARHHKDFEKLQELAGDMERSPESAMHFAAVRLRNIVG
jgi:chromosome segregation ATPase